MVHQVLKWGEVMDAVQKERERLLRMHCTLEPGRVEPMGRNLLAELMKPRHCVAILDGLALDLVLLYSQPQVASCVVPLVLSSDLFLLDSQPQVASCLA